MRTVNEVALLLRAAEALSARKEDRIHILIFGDGDELAELASKAQEEGLHNITFKGRVEKSYVPSILIRSDACVLNWKATPIIAFGMSMNKLFEYLAAGKPIVENNKPGYDLIEKCGCGVSENIENGEQYADVLVRLANLEKNEYLSMCDKALELSKEYDFEHLSKKLISVIQS